MERNGLAEPLDLEREVTHLLALRSASDESHESRLGFATHNERADAGEQVVELRRPSKRDVLTFPLHLQDAVVECIHAVNEHVDAFVFLRHVALVQPLDRCQESSDGEVTARHDVVGDGAHRRECSIRTTGCAGFEHGVGTALGSQLWEERKLLTSPLEWHHLFWLLDIWSFAWLPANLEMECLEECCRSKCSTLWS